MTSSNPTHRRGVKDHQTKLENLTTDQSSIDHTDQLVSKKDVEK